MGWTKAKHDTTTVVRHLDGSQPEPAPAVDSADPVDYPQPKHWDGTAEEWAEVVRKKGKQFGNFLAYIGAPLDDEPDDEDE